MIIVLSFIDNMYLSMYFLKIGSKNKMESSIRFSNIYHSLSRVINMSYPRVFRGISYIHVNVPAIGIRKFSTKLNKSDMLHLPPNSNEEFLFWFSGFSDGEGNFSITLDRSLAPPAGFTGGWRPDLD